MTARAPRFVEERLPEARGLGAALAELTEDPDAFTRVAHRGAPSASPTRLRRESRSASRPGSGATIGVRWPLVHAIERAAAGGRSRESSSQLHACGSPQRLARSEYREVRLFSLPASLRTLPDDPGARLAADAPPGPRGARLDQRRLARRRSTPPGILAEPFRWAEIEQLVYSQHRDGAAPGRVDARAHAVSS